MRALWYISSRTEPTGLGFFCVDVQGSCMGTMWSRAKFENGV